MSARTEKVGGPQVSGLDCTVMSVGRSSSSHAHLYTLQTSPAFWYRMACRIQIWNIFKKYPGYFAEICWKLARLDLWTPWIDHFNCNCYGVICRCLIAASVEWRVYPCVFFTCWFCVRPPSLFSCILLTCLRLSKFCLRYCRWFWRDSSSTCTFLHTPTTTFLMLAVSWLSGVWFVLCVRLLESLSELTDFFVQPRLCTVLVS